MFTVGLIAFSSFRVSRLHNMRRVLRARGRVIRRSGSSYGRSSLPSCCMLPVLSGASPMQSYGSVIAPRYPLRPLPAWPFILAFAELCLATADVRLSNQSLANKNHVLHCPLPPPSVTSQNFNMRSRLLVTDNKSHVLTIKLTAIFAIRVLSQIFTSQFNQF